MAPIRDLSSAGGELDDGVIICLSLYSRDNLPRWGRLTNRKSGDLQAALDGGEKPSPERRQFGRFSARLRRDQIEAGIRRQRDLERHHEPALGDVILDIGG